MYVFLDALLIVEYPKQCNIIADVSSQIQKSRYKNIYAHVGYNARNKQLSSNHSVTQGLRLMLEVSHDHSYYKKYDTIYFSGLFSPE